MNVTLIAVVLLCYAAISLLVWACCMVAGMADEASERLLERERELEDLLPGSDRQDAVGASRHH